jgi:Fe-S-cluster-containing hydrogenase component 2
LAQAITVENNLAVIDSEKCANCGMCAEKCPQKIIKFVSVPDTEDMDEFVRV